MVIVDIVFKDGDKMRARLRYCRNARFADVVARGIFRRHPIKSVTVVEGNPEENPEEKPGDESK